MERESIYLRRVMIVGGLSLILVFYFPLHSSLFSKVEHEQYFHASEANKNSESM